jgi:glycosyltransferase involved in cell wall biosynthesis
MLRNRLYYRVKPFVPQPLRTAIRRRLVIRSRASVAKVWPIIPGAERPPEGWPGWPGNKKFALVLTHDVESAVGLRKSLDLMRVEMELGFRSSFNFVPEGEYRVPAEVRNELTQNGFEVGIHDLKHDGRLYQSPRDFSQRAARINHYLKEWKAVGFRSAFMLRQLDWLHELNVQYDASTFDTDPFEPQPEGYHTIFPLWVPQDDRGHVKANGANSNGHQPRLNSDPGYVELPYTLPQDSTLFILLREETPEIWFRKLDWIAEHGGMALIITHPDYMTMDGAKRKGGEYPVEHYRQLLRYAEEKYSGQYWPALPREVAIYTRQIRSASIARNGHSAKEVALRASDKRWRLRGKRAAVLLFSYYPADPRPRRAAEALASEGVTIDVVCLQKDASEPRQEIVNGVSVFRIPIRRERGGKLRYVVQYSTFILRAFARLTAHSCLRRYDFVHVHNMPDVLVFSALVPKALGAKVVLDLHDPVPELMQTIFELPEQSFSVRLLKRLEKASIGFADTILTVNNACKKIYSSRSCAAEKINVVLNSPEDDIFQFRKLAPFTQNGKDPAKPFVILYHGSLVRRNGFDLAVDALEIARKSIPSAKLVVCGDKTPFFEDVMRSARERGLEQDVDYLGVRNRVQIVEAVNSCDLGIIPNHRNIFTEINTPTRIFEYLALGKAVIAPRTQGIRDYFGDDDLIFFEPGDSHDLARKIEFAFSHPAEVAKIVERGQQVYLAHRWCEEKSNLLDPISQLL